ncbi:hypothetical protein [Micromonospora sp. HUAS LYJ1]|uniref:hypothetical protein n=1 Tax=Micromonospora sp. HUAS LYJ1 TaxID=3061626 RepID=UPI002672AF27|nr:hypothetical protein [Micromonospora sp. HUAS LYJ1]WKU03381.1 hypothetical protein Q2K16_21340 [Micromonospora sp. HUAS LYJ1]
MTAWIAEAEQQRHQALAAHPPAARTQAVEAMTVDDIASLVAELGDIAGALAEAEPEHKPDLYRLLRLKLTYNHQTPTVRAIADLGAHRWNLVRVRGGSIP